jgi:PAS domain-containing protein
VDITQRKQAEQRLQLQYAVTQALSDALTVVDASAGILGRVCTALGWEAGVLWLVDQQSNVIRCHDFWRHAHSELSEFEAVSRGSVFPVGTGLPGRVWSTGQPVWIADVVQDNHFPRAPHARTAGLRGAFASPVHISDEVVGVLEFFSRTSETPDAETVALMAGIGGQLGQFVERKRAEAAAEREREQLREVFRRAPAAVALVCGSEHAFEFVNPTYVHTVGRHDAASLIGKPVREALPELESQGYVDLLDQVYRSGEAYVGQELSVRLNRAGDGTLEEAFFNLLLQPSRDDNGQVVGVTAIRRWSACSG